jgi:nucleoside-diphosphate kinase
VERTLVILKPDAVQRGLVGEILGRFERKGLKTVGLKMAVVDEATARTHYAVHEGKDFYEPLVAFITSGPSVLIVLEGMEAVAVVRRMIGSTFGTDAEPGTVRGDLGISRRFNLAHASDGAESAAREIALFFGAGECVAWERGQEGWIYDLSGPEPV